jgi:hypothetical protein
MVDLLAERINELKLYRKRQFEPHILLARHYQIIATKGTCRAQFPRHSRQAQLLKSIPLLLCAAQPSRRSLAALSYATAQTDHVILLAA